MTDSKTTTEPGAFPADGPSIEPLFIECKFTIHSRDKRISFEGCATSELYSALMDAVKKVLDDD